jgi:hypothetical protein
MSKSITLFNYQGIKADLRDVVDRKIIAREITDLNVRFSNDLLVELQTVDHILEAVEAKIRSCEIIFYTYFEGINHGILNGSYNPRDLPFVCDVEFNEGPSIMNHNLTFQDAFLYREAVNINFQQYILLMSSLYENLVRLSEVLLKKVVLHGKKNKPQSIPLPEYYYHLRTLIDFGYRVPDNLFNCFDRHAPFLDKYLPTMVALRNSFIHGYSINLATERSKYSITTFDRPLLRGAPELVIEAFTDEMLTHTRVFAVDLLEALKAAISIPAQTIPA